MSSELEIRVNQKDMLFDLLELKRDMEKSGISNLEALNRLIIKKSAVMEEEDVAHVEKKVSQLK